MVLLVPTTKESRPGCSRIPVDGCCRAVAAEVRREGVTPTPAPMARGKRKPWWGSLFPTCRSSREGEGGVEMGEQMAATNDYRPYKPWGTEPAGGTMKDRLSEPERVKVTTSPTAVGRCHRILELGVCIYEDNMDVSDTYNTPIARRAEHLAACYNACVGLNPDELVVVVDAAKTMLDSMKGADGLEQAPALGAVERFRSALVKMGVIL